MPAQEFLASFAVEIDEPGVSRLQQVLEENRKLAGELSAAFDTASASIRSLAEDLGVLPGFSGRGITSEGLAGFAGLVPELDLSQASKELEDFTERMKQPVSLKADASGITAAARNAWNSITGIFSAPVPVRIRAETGGDRTAGNLPETREPRSAGLQAAGVRQQLSAVSPAAGESLACGAGSLSLPSGTAAGTSAAIPVTQDCRTFSAPVSIQVQASGANPEEIGRRLYDTAERYLLRTLKGAMA